ncbi:hypothetical protein QJS04_geneDACA004848 [Acorus gramineus]|uniref:Uncharacterized protein n=1 Tax=Acorus gramineus TaxID=55184 RepID=A0AAV9BVI4_ACOGR|nr:hypothetical protein QJS04_geneDACA004848 [Acorus gramineus]
MNVFFMNRQKSLHNTNLACMKYNKWKDMHLGLSTGRVQTRTRPDPDPITRVIYPTRFGPDPSWTRPGGPEQTNGSGPGPPRPDPLDPRPDCFIKICSYIIRPLVLVDT